MPNACGANAVRLTLGVDTVETASHMREVYACFLERSILAEFGPLPVSQRLLSLVSTAESMMRYKAFSVILASCSR